MSDDLGENHTGASMWPLVIAVSLALSEIGVVLGFAPISVGGLLVLVLSISGILRESGYVLQMDRSAGFLSVLLIVSGVMILLSNQPRTTTRGQSILIAGVVSLLAALAWRAFLSSRLQLSKEETQNQSSTEEVSD